MQVCCQAFHATTARHSTVSDTIRYDTMVRAVQPSLRTVSLGQALPQSFQKLSTSPLARLTCSNAP